MTILSGCGKEPTPLADYPLPGHMQVLSVEAAQRMYTANLIFNGDFSVWDSASPAPEGFFAPTERPISDLRRIDSKGGGGRYTVDQWWRESDADLPFSSKFHTVVPNIQPGHVYELIITGQARDDATAFISVIALDVNNTQIGAWSEPLVIDRTLGGNESLRKKIRTDHQGKLAIAAHIDKQTSFEGPVRVWWFEWQLVKSGGIGDEMVRADSTPM